MLSSTPAQAPSAADVRTARIRVAATALVLLAVVGGGIWLYVRSRPASGVRLPSQPALPTTSVSQLADQLVHGGTLLVLDLRSQSEFLASHIPDAVSMPAYQVLRSSDQLSRFAGWTTVLVCQTPGCSEVTQATRDLHLLGFQDLHELEGGFAAYQAANLTLASQAKLVQQDLVDVLKGITVPTITVADLKARSDVMLVDTRTPYEFATGFIPGATDLPLYATQTAIDTKRYPKDRTIVVYDREGNRSRIAAKALLDAGYAHVLSLEGGLTAWTTAGGELNFPKQDGSDIKQLIPLLDQKA